MLVFGSQRLFCQRLFQGLFLPICEATFGEYPRGPNGKCLICGRQSKSWYHVELNTQATIETDTSLHKSTKGLVRMGAWGDWDGQPIFESGGMRTSDFLEYFAEGRGFEYLKMVAELEDSAGLFGSCEGRRPTFTLSDMVSKAVLGATAEWTVSAS